MTQQPGCLRNTFTGIGCLTVLAVIGFGAWFFRGQLAEVYRTVRGAPDDNGSASEAILAVGRPSPEDLRSAEAKEGEIARRGGRDHIVFTPDEMASIIRDRLNPAARRVLDSIRITLERDRIALEADLLTQEFGSDLLGPLSGFIDPREPIRASGTAEVRAPGVIAWKIDEFVVASFPFPRPAIPLLVDRLTGGSDGVILLAVPATVGDVQIRPNGVTFYRRTG